MYNIKISLLFFAIVTCFNVFAQDSNYDFSYILKYENIAAKVVHSNNDSLKMAAIEFLLAQKGNKKLNKTWFGYTNPEKLKELFLARSSDLDDYPRGTNQFVALFLISSIYHGTFEFCEEFNIYYIDGNKLIRTTNMRVVYFPKGSKKPTRRVVYRVEQNKEIKKMYQIYEHWFEGVKLHGLDNVLKPTLIGKYFWDSPWCSE